MAGEDLKIKNEIIYKNAHISPSGQNGMWPKEKNDKFAKYNWDPNKYYNKSCYIQITTIK